MEGEEGRREGGESVSEEGREEKRQGRCFLRKMEKGGSEKLVKNI